MDVAYTLGDESGYTRGLDTAKDRIRSTLETDGYDSQKVADIAETIAHAPPPSIESTQERILATTPSTLGYRGPAACTAAGISYRQLDYWARTGLVVPSVRGVKGSGSQRLYSPSDIYVLAVTKRLLDVGVSLHQIREAIEYLRKVPEGTWSITTLIGDGRNVHIAHTSAEVAHLMTGGKGAFGIGIGSLMSEIDLKLAECPAELRPE